MIAAIHFSDGHTPQPIPPVDDDDDDDDDKSKPGSGGGNIDPDDDDGGSNDEDDEDDDETLWSDRQSRRAMYSPITGDLCYSVTCAVLFRFKSV